MRYPLLWIAGLIVVGLAAYWLLERLSPRAEESPTSVQATSIPPSESASPLSDSAAQPQSKNGAVPPSPAPSQTASPKKAQSPQIKALFHLDHISAQSSLPCQIVRHIYYLLCYVEAHEQPSWTAYILDGEKLKEGRLRRTQDFREDPKVATQSATLSDYRRSGYDRGHLVPAGDFKWDSIGMSETFYLSNMSPQLHEFNAGIWEAIERTVRTWAKEKKQLVVYTGPLLRPRLSKIGRGVSVPDTFYKVVYALSGNEIEAVAFLVPHRPFPENAVARFMVPVDSVEKVTGIDFFPALPDAIEEKAESRWNKSSWPVRVTKR